MVEKLKMQQKDVLLSYYLGLARFVQRNCASVVPLYNVYCKTTTAKELWESLERKYKTEDVGTKKFVVARFLDYKMVDSKNVERSLFKTCRFCYNTTFMLEGNDFE
ncbi:hypothetical protein Tco_0658966 [Tanacetum coccineum]|uniref:Zinc finger, CCHC-type n=1 Tax=Tanacetum coccineum TaxID=301880 RepID=A0ABQ5D9I2_9ASTR